jgi:hypothetical protein
LALVALDLLTTKEGAMRARALSHDHGQEATVSSDKSGRDLTAERFVDSLLGSGRYHDADGKLDIERLVADVRRIQVALTLTRPAGGAQ